MPNALAISTRDRPFAARARIFAAVVISLRIALIASPGAIGCLQLSVPEDKCNRIIYYVNHFIQKYPIYDPYTHKSSSLFKYFSSDQHAADFAGAGADLVKFCVAQ